MIRISRAIFPALLAITLALASLVPVEGRARTIWQAKVDPWVLDTAAAGETEFLVFLTEQADLGGAAGLKTRLERGQYVYRTLTRTAGRTQGPVIASLRALEAQFRPYWVANMIWVRGDQEVVAAMASRPEVAHIYANPRVRLVELPVDPQAAPASPAGVEWSITHVGAPDVWAEGFTGQGVVIAGHDTGYEWDHPALINQYRGWDGASANHDYNWHDAIHSGGGVCGPDSPEPCDDHNHGTHTMGTMVGDDGGANQIGMAPGARWIGCRNMDQGNGTPATYAECYEFFIAPYPVGGDPMTDGDPSKAPHVINNSWSCPVSEGCTDPNALLAVVQAVRAAGIVTAHAAGNSGPLCSTVDDPAAIYAGSFTVGATDSQDNIAAFSSRGPVTVDASNRRKPDISAPGVGIRSSIRGGGYQGGWQGTSMAAPHVAGQVALLISAQPALAGQVDQIEQLIEATAVPRTSGQGCGGDGPGDVPNNVYGWGRIDALGAYQGLHQLVLQKSASPALAPGETLTYTLHLSHTHLVSLTTNVVLTDVVPAGTVFLTATQPYSLSAGIVRWDFASLAPGESRTVELAVSVPLTATGVVVNAAYGARSDQVSVVRGTPVTTTLQGALQVFIPFVAED